ncbi:DUF4082 domain-containing protein [Nocardioides sp.]|uniref:DUF4082 domain-containing protein n=1 Tax=Nocardioides sp. TaxID=35761 RepID=UPI00262AFD1C|nr:DUF4082 domain-containing protein [Nocardioides sp.]
MRRTRSWGARASALLLVAALNALAGPALLGGPTPANAADPCAAGGNKVACENSKPGTDAEIWDIEGAGSDSIQGFSTDISVNVGQRIDFKIKTVATSYTIDIYRIGYYQGLGARKIASVTPSASLPQSQPNCITDIATELYDCGNWAVSASWNVPSTAVSGVYVALLKRSNGDASHITFVVRDDASTSAVVFQTSDPTWQAYNTYGGSDFYQGGANGRAYKVSYNRPVTTRGDNGGRDAFFSAEYPMVRFLEQNGYDVSYIAGVDTDRRGNLLTNHKVFLSVGHDEYWSGAQRANVEAARAAGVNLQFLSGNEVYWRTRYEPSLDSSHTAYRTLVSYKETWANAKIDPSPQSTSTWRDPRLAPSSQGGGRPENNLTGTAYISNFSELPITVSSEEGKLRMWRNTSLASLPAGSKAALSDATIGYESNEDLDNGHRPAGLIRMSTTIGDVPQVLQDFGNVTLPGQTEHHITLYKAASGALVFSAGTIQWSWGLDDTHDRVGGPADARMRQFQVNLFADMGVQPFALASGLVTATKSTDTTAPTVAITAPATTANQDNGKAVTVTGTASDVGGRVAGVEVSLDAGETWHAATGTTSWSYTTLQRGVGAVSVRARAMDDSANIGAAVTRAYTAKCPCSIFGTSVPKTPAVDDASSAELGLRFIAGGDGFATGVRFYKGTGNTGTHVGSLWSSSGAKLATVTFSGETASGWQQASFASPVALAAGQTYVVSYTVPNGHYPVQSYAFAASPLDTGALLVEGGFGAASAGVFGSAGSFPNQSYQGSNYYVDVLFNTQDASPLIATNQLPLAGSSSVPVGSTVSARFTKPLTAGSAGLVLKDSTNATVAGTTAYDATTRTVTFTPSQPLAGFVTYTATVSGTDAQGNQVSAGTTWSFRSAKPPATPGVCPCTLFDENEAPTVLEATDGSPVTVGTRFTTTQNGMITGVRFYKSQANTGSHVGTLWNAAGTALASGTFTGESTAGWQELMFAQPVSVNQATDYIVSYHSPTGLFSHTTNGFLAENQSRGPITVTGTSGSYSYGTGFPGSSSSNNYYVDPIFAYPAPSISVTSQDPAPGAVGVARGSVVSVRLSAPVAPGYTFALSQSGTAVAGTTTASADRTKLTFTPTQPLPKDVLVTASLTGVVSDEGAALPAQQWTFRTSGDDDVSRPQSMFGDLVPQVQAADDSASVELGTRFVPAADGKVTAIRFFKGAGNGGTHTGSIWNAAGVRLATVTFTNETVTGWQTAVLATPLDVSEGQEYVVSYLAPQGRYSTTPQFFANAWVDGDLTAPASSNGRYVYGSGYPAYSYNATNYFVDVVYRKGVPTITSTGHTPASGATDVATSVAPTVSFSAQIATGWSFTVKDGATTVPGTAALSTDGKTLTFTPTGGLPAGKTLTATVSGVVSTRGAVLATQTWSFTTKASATAVSTLLGSSTPATASSGDSSDIELGMAFTTSKAGSVKAIRFYKGAGNTGTHTGSIWSSAGVRLATVTFANETASGWQTAALASPLALTPGETYVVSYYAPNGNYSLTGAFFTSPVTSGPLTAAATQNGRYVYGWGGGFPASSWNATNYFVDIEFEYAVP